jgi:hypothetical protein
MQGKDEIRIYFVTWPDGKLFEGTQTSIDEEEAIAAALRTWLIPQWFPGLELGRRYGGGPMRNLWEAMQKAGFKVQSVATEAKGMSA